MCFLFQNANRYALWLTPAPGGSVIYKRLHVWGRNYLFHMPFSCWCLTLHSSQVGWEFTVLPGPSSYLSSFWFGKFSYFWPPIFLAALWLYGKFWDLLTSCALLTHSFIVKSCCFLVLWFSLNTAFLNNDEIVKIIIMGRISNVFKYWLWARHYVMLFKYILNILLRRSVKWVLSLFQWGTEL